MKGIVFSFKKNDNKHRFNRKSKTNYKTGYIRKIDFKYLFRRYGIFAFFTAILVAGLTTGTVLFQNFNSDIMSRLDFLFTTNLPQRLQNGAFGAFCASFASDFMFLLLAFLMGLSLWGIGLLPFIIFFKGFGIGVSAAYLFINYSVGGLIFYLTILLPGLFLFSMVLVYQSTNSYNISKKLIKNLFLKEEYSIKASLKIYLKKSLVYLIGTVLASFLDMALWFTFAGLFNFK